MFFVYVNNRHEHLTIDESSLADADTLMRIRELGWVLLWDSAPTAFAGAAYAAQNYDCPSPCLIGESRHPLTRRVPVGRGPAPENDHDFSMEG